MDHRQGLGGIVRELQRIGSCGEQSPSRLEETGHIKDT